METFQETNQDRLQKSVHHVSNSLSRLLLQLAGIFLVGEILYGIIQTLAVSFIDITNVPSFVFLLNVVFAAKVVLQLIIIFALIIPWGSTQYYITSDDKLIRYQGFFSRNENFYDLKTVGKIMLHQGFFGRQLNYGNVTIQVMTAGEMETVTMRGIFDPKKYERIFRKLLTGAPGTNDDDDNESQPDQPAAQI